MPGFADNMNVMNEGVALKLGPPDAKDKEIKSMPKFIVKNAEGHSVAAYEADQAEAAGRYTELCQQSDHRFTLVDDTGAVLIPAKPAPPPTREQLLEMAVELLKVATFVDPEHQNKATDVLAGLSGE